MAVVIVLCAGAPVGAFAWIAARRNAEGGRRWPGVWRAFWVGALAFIVSQLLTRIPLMTLVVPTLGADVSASCCRARWPATRPACSRKPAGW